MIEIAFFSGKIYTADKNFTRPPVATVATNSKSGSTVGHTSYYSIKQICGGTRWAEVCFPTGFNLGQCSCPHKADLRARVAQTLVIKYL